MERKGRRLSTPPFAWLDGRSASAPPVSDGVAGPTCDSKVTPSSPAQSSIGKTMTKVSPNEFV